MLGKKSTLILEKTYWQTHRHHSTLINISNQEITQIWLSQYCTISHSIIIWYIIACTNLSYFISKNTHTSFLYLHLFSLLFLIFLSKKKKSWPAMSLQKTLPTPFSSKPPCLSLSLSLKRILNEILYKAEIEYQYFSGFIFLPNWHNWQRPHILHLTNYLHGFFFTGVEYLLQLL